MPLNDTTWMKLVEEQLEAGRQVRLTMGGRSMESALHEGDVLVLEPLMSAPRKGDVVLFFHEGQYIIHRMVACREGVYIMQGDNNHARERVRRGDLLARVARVEHKGASIEVPSGRWSRRSGWSVLKGRLSSFVRWAVGRQGRQRLRPWYFVVLALLMWAPLNGFGVPLDNYLLGLRADHLLHASIYLLCPLFWVDVFPRRWMVWVASIGVGILTESVQYLLPWRGFDINDMVANALGATIGWALLQCVLKNSKL